MSASITRHRLYSLLIGAILAVAIHAGWRYWEHDDLFTQDAVLLLPTPLSPSNGGDVVMLPAEDTSVQLAVATDDLRLFVESIEASKQAISEAIVMVREQKENFDFAEDRYEKLMPLVETGALEPLAASQIQSAYISARAALSQSKFLLGQARRDFGSENTRIFKLAQLKRNVEKWTPRISPNDDKKTGVSDLSVGETQQKEMATLASAAATVFAFFPDVPAMEGIVPGRSAQVSSPVWGKGACVAKVQEVSKISTTTGKMIRVRLTADSIPDTSPEQSGIPCEVRLEK